MMFLEVDLRIKWVFEVIGDMFWFSCRVNETHFFILSYSCGIVNPASVFDYLLMALMFFFFELQYKHKKLARR